MRFLLIACGLLLTVVTTGQQVNYGHWYEFGMDTKVAKGLRFGTETGLRFGYDGLIAESFYTDLNLTYKLNDVLRAEVAYRLGTKNDLDNWQGRERWSLGLRAKGSVGKWDVSWRARVQSPPIGFAIERAEFGLQPTYRNRFRVQKKLWKKTWFSAGFETFHRPAVDHLQWTDWRAQVRIKRKLDKRLYGQIGLMHQRELDDSFPTHEWVLQFSCQWEWKRKKKESPDAATP